MVTKKLKAEDKRFLKELGKNIEKIILTDKGYSSLDAFSIAYYDLIAKPTLYQICRGERDMKLSTLRNLAKALETPLVKLIAKIEP
ncbi:MAG: hypothetical protein KBD78_14420 [Oligoflexales bacterium]|nr:hypothetical protein [Oligoflexales bacterium]